MPEQSGLRLGERQAEWQAMNSDKIEKSWLDCGNGLPVFWDAFRKEAIDGLKEWAKRRDGEDRIAFACKTASAR